VGELWLVTAKNQQRKTTRELHEEMSQRARYEEKIDEKKRAVGSAEIRREDIQNC